MSHRLSRSVQRAWQQVQTDARKFQRRLFTPAQWPWKRIALAGGVVMVATIAGCEAERRRAVKLAESRVFRQGSPLFSIENSLRTGDIILFNRAVLDPGVASINPLRMALVMMQKLHGRCEYDHVGIIVIQNDYPYVLERGINGAITLRPFDSRLLQSSSNEIILRRLQAPPMNEADQDRMNAWIEHLMHGPTNASASTTAAPAPLAVVSSGPRIPPFALLRHLIASYFISSVGSTSLPRSNAIANLGHLLEVSAQLCTIDERIDALIEKADPSTLKGFDSSTGSTNPIQRLQVRRREVQMRFDSLMRQFSETDTSVFPPLTSSSSSPDTELHSISDFPSAVLVVQTLQVLGILPDRRRGPMQLTEDVQVPPPRIPPSTAYPTRQFLSSSSLPLVYNPPRSSGATGATTELVDCFFDREMFIKAKHRALPYTIEEY